MPTTDREDKQQRSTAPDTYSQAQIDRRAFFVGATALGGTAVAMAHGATPASPAPAGGDSFLQSGTGAVSRSLTAKVKELAISPYDFGAAGNGTTDDTTALSSAYARAAAMGADLEIPPGIFKFTSQLLWNGRVNVRGKGQQEKCMLVKTGNFNGILIDAGGQYCCYENFYVQGGAGNAGVGIQIDQGHFIKMRNVIVFGHGSHGIHVTDSLVGRYEEIVCVSNGGDGFRMEALGDGAINSCLLLDIECILNRGWGFNLVSGNQIVAHNIVMEQNVAGGGRVDKGAANSLGIYLEANKGPGFQITSNSTRTHLHTTLGDDAAGEIEDDGTNTTITGPGLASGYIRVRGIQPPKPFAPGAGRTLALVGGHAKTRGNGGDLLLSGGDAAGGGSGGAVRVNGRAFYPSTAAGSQQGACAIFAGSGTPSNREGQNGDFYFRSDGTRSGNTCIYHKEAGAWVALGA